MMSEAILDNPAQNPAPEPPRPSVDNEFISDLVNKATYKINKKTRESREYLKQIAENDAKKSTESVVQNVSYETKTNGFKKILGVAFLGIGIFCIGKVIYNVKNAKKTL